MTAIAIDAPPTTVTADSGDRRSWRERAIRGREDDPRWVRPTLVGLLAATALLYLWGLGASGWANSFYSAAVQAGSTSWKAFFFGSFDSSNFITVDKPPAALWVMDLSARLFGVNAWSILVPQALEGVAAVGLLYATVRRHFAASAALIAGAVLATTPVATLMFRFNNPDALLVLLLVAAAYAVTRAIESASTRWLLFAGALVGFGFLTKMLQAFLVVPGFGLAYLVFAQTTLRRRIGQLVAAAVAVVIAAGWWVAAVMLTPASMRPYVGGSTNNSILQLAFGYNGLGRLTGNETGSVGGGGGRAGTGMWGATGITRLFGSDMGGQISWLIPAALLLGAAAWWGLRHLPRSSGQQSQLLLWGSWLIVTGLVFSFGKGIIHPYYTVALAPAVGGLVGIGAVTLWRLREQLRCRVAMAGILLTTALWSYRLLDRSPSWHPWLRVLVLILGVVVVTAALVAPQRFAGSGRRVGRLIAAGALVVALAGPVAYSLDSASTAHDGAIPSAGPAVATASFGGPGGGGGPGGAAGFGARGGFGPPPAFGGARPGVGGGGQAGGLLNAGSVSSALTTALKSDASSYRWVAAAVGAENAAGYQLASAEPVMAIGGFNGTDPAPSLVQFEEYVSEGEIHYFIASGSSDSSEITQWVESHFTATTIGGTTVYDLTASTS